MISSLFHAVVYLDTSALVKHYSSEIGSAWINSFFLPTVGYTVATICITKAEAAAAFASKHRQKSLSKALYAQALIDLAYDFEYEYHSIFVDQALIDQAVDLTTRHKLRGYDAMQLATALSLNNLLFRPNFLLSRLLRLI